jgi:peptide/nickel transport system permease protein
MADVLPAPSIAQRLRPVRDHPGIMAGLLLFAGLLSIGLAAPLLVPADLPTMVDPARILQRPTWNSPLGTDQFGRDLLQLILLSLRTDLLATVSVIAGSFAGGVLVGAVSGFAGGIADEGLMRLTDIFLAVPPFVLAMAVASALGRELWVLVVAMAIATWPPFARLARGQVLKEKGELYVEALHALGIPRRRILLAHMLPNSIFPVLAYAATIAGVTMLYLAGLSYIGFGPGPFVPELGQLIARGQRYTFSAPWLVLGPGFVLFVTVLALNLIGEGLRDVVGREHLE